MANSHSKDFVGGVIEAFYGPPWTRSERLHLFDWMSGWGLNTYFYAPKDDLKHRAVWRERYSEAEASAMHELIRACESRHIRFLYALSPGLDIRFHDASELVRLKERFDQMLKLGCGHFALLFDDIPDRMDPEDQKRWGTMASAQCYVANAMYEWLRAHRRDAELFFCPTPYCSRMAAAELGGPNYLATIGREMNPEVDIFWTGPEIISREITVQHAEEIGAILRRKPVIWDNLHANDYDGRRFFCGPYAGRPAGLRKAVRGVLSNPNCEFPLNYVPLRTLGRYVRGGDSWNPREEWITALREWLPSFATTAGAIAFEDLTLFADCHYLPYDDGASAGELYAVTERLLASDPASWAAADLALFRDRVARLANVCGLLAALKDRPLFGALFRRIWELREEFDLLGKYVEQMTQPSKRTQPFREDFHLPGTYRGSYVARLQALLPQKPDGTFAPARRGAGPAA